MTSPFGTIRAWRNAILGTFLVLIGIGAAMLTAYSSRGGDPRVTSGAAIAALVVVGLIVIFVLPPLARSAGAEFAQIDLPLQVTAGGMIFIGLMVIVGFAAFNTGNNLLFLVLALLAATLFVSLVAAQITLRNLVVSARFPDHIFAGEPAPVVVTLRNTKRITPSLSVLVEARGPKDNVKEAPRRRKRAFRTRALAYFAFVPHRAGAEQKVEQLFPHRGHELITGFELSTRAPFGFLRHRRRLRARDVDIIILPKPQAVADRLHLLPMNTGRLLSSRRGAGHDLLSLRDYQPHDDLRHIDWKATARSRQLMIREFAAEDERRVNIWLDTRPLEGEQSGAQSTGNEQSLELAARFEFAVTQAASLIAHFIDERAEVRLILGADTGRIGVGKQHLYECLKRLALVEQTAAGDIFTARENFESVSAVDGSFTILLTPVSPGSIPAEIWRTSHVVYF